MLICEKPIYKLIDNKGRIYVPKFLRDVLEMEEGDIVRMEVDKEKLTVRKVHIIEAGDKSPEATEAFVRAAVQTMPSETQLSIAAQLIRLAEQKNNHSSN